VKILFLAMLLAIAPIVSALPTEELFEVLSSRPWSLNQIKWVGFDERAVALAAISGDGKETPVHWHYNSPRLSMYDHGTGQLAWEHMLQEGGGEAALSVARTSGRVTVVFGSVFTGRMHLALFEATEPTPVWVKELPRFTIHPGSAPVDVSSRGSIVAVTYRASGGKFLDVYDGDSGVLRWSKLLPGALNFAVIGTDVADDGSRIMVGLGDRSMIFSSSGELLAEFSLTTCCDAPALSHDGNSALLRGRAGDVRVVSWDGANYVPSWSVAGEPVPHMAALSPTGETVAVFDAGIFCGGSPRVLVYRLPSPWPYSSYDRYGAGACPRSLAFSLDGTRLVVGTQGTVEDDVTPEDYLRDIATILDVRTPLSPLPLFRLLDDVDEPGSVTKASLSDDGKSAVISTKKVHAQVLGNGGRVWGIELVA
jgi:hypothetical protein